MNAIRGRRLVAVGAMVAAAAMAMAARPALAARAEGDIATWTAVQLGGSSMSCALGGPALAEWSCQTSTPIVASGLTCVQTIHADVAGRTVSVPLTGCTASLSFPAGNWGIAVANCNRGYPIGAGCQAVAVGGAALFSFQPVQPGLAPSYSDQLATITDAACDNTGGHATVEAVDANDGYSMDGTVTWVGNCTTVSDLTWTANLTVV